MDRIAFASGSGSFAVSQNGGRITELRAEADGPNLLWQGATAAVWGGDRLWVAPELEIFYDERGTWRCPPELDPGSWTAERMGDDIVLTEHALGCTLVRTVGALGELAVPGGLRWAGYTVRDDVRTLRGWSAWHLVMVPAPVRVFVRQPSEPVEYYTPVPAVSGGWIGAPDTPPRWKIGFAPPRDGRVVLAAMSPAQPGAVVMVLAEADPDGTYVDVSPHSGTASAVQVYGSGGEGFCELEHHAPLETRSTKSTVVGAWGPMEARLELIESFA